MVSAIGLGQGTSFRFARGGQGWAQEKAWYCLSLFPPLTFICLDKMDSSGSLINATTIDTGSGGNGGGGGGEKSTTTTSQSLVAYARRIPTRGYTAAVAAAANAPNLETPEQPASSNLTQVKLMVSLFAWVVSLTQCGNGGGGARWWERRKWKTP